LGGLTRFFASRRSSIVFLTIGFTLALIFAFWNSPTRSSEYFWSPANGDSGGRFELSRTWPQELGLVADCGKIREGGDGLVFDSGGLRLEFIGGRIYLRSSENSEVQLSLPMPEGQCETRVDFEASSGVIALTVGGETKQVVVDGPPFPKVDRLETGAYRNNPVESVRVLTRPWGVHHSIGRGLIGVLSAVFTLLALIGSWIRGNLHKNSNPKFHGGISRQGIAIAGFLFIASFLITPFYDDGWVIERVRRFTSTGVLSNIYDASDAWLPQGNSHELVIGFLDHLGFPLIWLRFFVIVLLLVAWEILRKFVLVEMLEAKQNALWVAGSLYACFASVWLLSLRAEAWVVLFGAIAWAGFARFKRDNSELPLFFALIGAGFAFSAHQTGWVVVPVGIVSVVLALVRFLRKQVDFLTIGIPILAAVTFCVINQFVVMGPSAVLEGIREFGQQGTHSSSFFSEYVRYEFLLNGSSGARVVSVSFLGLFVLISALVLNRFESNSLRVWGLAFSCLVGLTFTSSKWAWHFGVYAIVAVIFVVLAFRELDKSPKRMPFFVLILPGVVFLVSLSSSITNTWSLTDLVNSTWQEFVDVVGSGSKSSVWIVLILSSIALACAADFARRRNFKPAATFTTCLALVLLPSLAFGWIGVDALRGDAWSFPRQNFQQLFGRSLCDESRFVTGVLALPESSNALPDMPAMQKNAYPKVGSLAELPQGFGEEGWGTWFLGPEPLNESNQVSPESDAAIGRFAGPGFALADSSFVGVALATGNQFQNSFAMQFFDASGNQIENRVLKLAKAGVWELHYVGVPKKAVTVRVVNDDRSGGVGGWGAISAVRAVVTENSIGIERSGPVFIGAFEGFKYPCLKLAGPQGGVWPPITYLTDEDTFFSEVVFGPEVVINDVLCGTGDVSCLRKPQLQMAVVDRID